uniref:Phosphatidate cytidylyltransferase n=1 Tax=Globisporangium ultimum (strain ATCC 200006 / CBS 805.95 / DAOM BR144) TaxID=431595 RepID=K3WRV4_GLOUD
MLERGDAASCQSLPSARRKRPLTRVVRNAGALVALLLAPALVLVLLQASCAYAVLYLCQAVVAFGGLELSWWHFRIRKRLLIPFAYEHENLSRDEYDAVVLDQVNPATCAVAPLATKFFCGRNWLAAWCVSIVVAGSVVAIVWACQGAIANVEKSTIGWRMVLSCSALAALSCSFCACFAPTPRDGFVIVMYQTCFTVSSLNTFLAHADDLVNDPELLDSLYVVLVGACVTVVWRIVASKDVLETLLTITLDMFGLVYLVSPMMEMADFVDHPLAHKYRDKIATFWLVISAAEVGHFLFQTIRTRFPSLFQKCHHPLAKSISTTYDLEDLVVSTCFGVAGAVVAIIAFPEHSFDVWELVILTTGVVLSQVSRLAIDTFKSIARVTSAHGVKWSLWNNSVMTLASPYLVGAILFHPYIKSLFTETSAST